MLTISERHHESEDFESMGNTVPHVSLKMSINNYEVNIDVAKIRSFQKSFVYLHVT